MNRRDRRYTQLYGITAPEAVARGVCAKCRQKPAWPSDSEAAYEARRFWRQSGLCTVCELEEFNLAEETTTRRHWLDVIIVITTILAVLVSSYPWEF